MTRRRIKHPTPAELEAQADEILRKSHSSLLAQRDAMRELIIEAEKLEQCHQELLRPRNDPDYMQAIAGHEADRNAIANEVSAIHHVMEGGRNRAVVAFNNDRDRAKAVEIIESMGRHFEAPVYRQEDSEDPTIVQATYKQQPKRAFGREKRSKPR